MDTSINREFCEQIIKQLELLIEYGHIYDMVYLIQKNDKLIGFEFTTENEPTTIRSGEIAEHGTVLDLYVLAKSKLGINNYSAMIKAHRLNLGYTLQELADKIDKTKQELNRWESGVKPSQEIFDVIMMHLN